MVKLNDQEWRLLMLLAEGKSAKQIGKTLGLADKTIRNHLTPIYKALGVAGSKEAITYYRRHCAEVAAKSPVWYVQCLLDAAFDSARRCWLDTPRDSRPASVRLAMCIIFHLLKDPALAMAEAQHLQGEEATAFYLFSQWQAGEKNAYALLEKLLPDTSPRCRNVMHIGIYHVHYRNHQYQCAADGAYELLVKSLKLDIFENAL